VGVSSGREKVGKEWKNGKRQNTEEKGGGPQDNHPRGYKERNRIKSDGVTAEGGEGSKKTNAVGTKSGGIKKEALSGREQVRGNTENEAKSAPT